MFGGIAKWVFEIDRPERIPELVARAFATAVAGRPGPGGAGAARGRALGDDRRPGRRARAARGRCARRRPTSRACASCWPRPSARSRSSAVAAGRRRAAADIAAFLDGNGIPAAASFRCQDVVDNRLPVYCGDLGLGVNPALAPPRARGRRRARDRHAALGDRDRRLHVPDAARSEPRRSCTCTRTRPSSGASTARQLGIVSALPEFAAAARALEPFDGSRYADWRAAARADYEATLSYEPAPGNGVDMAVVLEQLRGRLPDAIVANGAGNYTVWVHRFWQFSRYRSQLAPLSGAMGYGVPAAVAGKLVHPERPVVAFAGDGCFLMCAQELATMVANDLAGPRDRRQQRHARRRSACTRSATTRAA